MEAAQSVHVIWTEKASVHEVSTFKPPLCITSIPMKMNWPFCFYEFLGYFLSRKDSQSLVG